MSPISLLAVSAGLGMDAMSVSAAVGVKWHGPKQRFRLAWHMGLFQFVMPLIGFSLGKPLAERLARLGSYFAGSLILALGAKMLYEALKSHPGAAAEKTEHSIEARVHIQAKDPTRGWSLLVLSVATSLDALVVGFSLGLAREVNIWLASLVIGAVAGGMSLLGVAMGKRLGKAIGRPVEIAGACVLMALGVIFLLS